MKVKSSIAKLAKFAGIYREKKKHSRDGCERRFAGKVCNLNVFFFLFAFLFASEFFFLCRVLDNSYDWLQTTTKYKYMQTMDECTILKVVELFETVRWLSIAL